LPPNEQELTQDLELDTLFRAMSSGDDFLYGVSKKAVLSSLTDVGEITYRQDILKDCINNSSIVREIYHIPIEAVEGKKKHYIGIFDRYPSSILSNSIRTMQLFLGLLRKIRKIADEHSNGFKSEGFTTFFNMIKTELNDEYLSTVQEHLRNLEFRGGVLISAVLGKGNEGADYVLRKPNENNQNWFQRIVSWKPTANSFYISERDESGARAIYDLRDRGINLVANALAQSSDHIDSFLKMLRIELGFYIGCLNLHEQLCGMDEPVSFPIPVPVNDYRHSFLGLYDACLALTVKRKVVGNDLIADGKDVVIITGANQGGKSIFLRSLGLAQLMMQCGMFVAAESYCSKINRSIFTHYKREEDISMKSGKLDEELSRMNDIANLITPNSLLLLNESFSATNEREGSEIARQIVQALLENGIKIIYVTHLYEFARGLYEQNMSTALFLRAERKSDGSRTFKLVQGEPLQTSFGEDLYRNIFGESIF